MSWLEDVSAHGVTAVGTALGLHVAGTVNRGLAPCPSCERGSRGSRDRRGPVGVRPDNQGWRCHRCDAHGDPINLASWVITGCAKPHSSEDWATVRDACADAGLCDPDEKRERLHKRERLLPLHKRERCTPFAKTTPKRPPAHEVAALWDTCNPASDDTEVAAWLRGRGLDPARLTELDLVRALPTAATVPAWAWFGLPWPQTSHRIIVPMRGPSGAIETLHARATHPSDPKGRDKAASPKGYAVGGAVLADAQGAELLRTGAGAERLIIAEGVPDFLTWASHPTLAIAVVGILAGSFTDAIAERIPSGCRVLIRTHPDKAGAKYAHQISTALRDRCQVFVRTKEATQP